MRKPKSFPTTLQFQYRFSDKNEENTKEQQKLRDKVISKS